MRDEFLDPQISDVVEESDESGLRPKHLEEFIGRSIQFRAEDLFAREQFDIIPL